MSIAIDDRMHLLDRCLRLEAQLLGIAILAPAQPSAPLPPPRMLRPIYRVYQKQSALTHEEITQIHALRAQGLSYRMIAKRTGRSDSTIGRYVREMRGRA